MRNLTLNILLKKGEIKMKHNSCMEKMIFKDGSQIEINKGDMYVAIIMKEKTDSYNVSSLSNLIEFDSSKAVDFIPALENLLLILHTMNDVGCNFKEAGEIILKRRKEEYNEHKNN